MVKVLLRMCGEANRVTLTNFRNFDRIEGKGKGILQHHQVIAEFEEIPEESRQKLTDGAFGEVLRSTQVTNSFRALNRRILAIICGFCFVGLLMSLFILFVCCRKP